MAKRILSPNKTKTTNKITVKEPAIDYEKLPIIFSFEKLVGDNYCYTHLEDNDKKQLIESIVKRRKMSWTEIKGTSRHGLGMEKIDRKSIKGTIPRFITEDMEHFLAFRFSGLKPMIGYREKNIFYILWLDNNFTLYSHG